MLCMPCENAGVLCNILVCKMKLKTEADYKKILFAVTRPTQKNCPYQKKILLVFLKKMFFLYPTTQKVAGYYVIPSELECPSICLSVSTSFPCSNFSTFWPIFFKLCIDRFREGWYEIASGLISFWNNKVMALDVCQKCFALRFRAVT